MLNAVYSMTFLSRNILRLWLLVVGFRSYEVWWRMPQKRHATRTAGTGWEYNQGTTR